MAETMLGLGLLVFLAHVFTALFERRRIPDVLMLMLLGLMLGPFLRLVHRSDLGKVGGVLSTVALIVILFESGLTLDPKVIGKTWRPTLNLTLSTFTMTVLTCALAGHFWLGLTPLMATVLGSVLGGVSAAVAIALVKSMRVKDPTGTVLIMESALGDVLSIVLLLGLMDAAREGAVQPLHMLGEILASIVFASLFGLAGGVVWLLILNRVRRLPNSAFTTLAFVLIIYGVTEEFEFSGAIAALAFGATITNHHYLRLDRSRFLRGRNIGELSETDILFYNEILFLLKSFFFVYLGVSIRFTDTRAMWIGACIVLVIYLIRPLLVKVALSSKGAGVEEASIAAIMAPKGLVSAVLAALPIERGLPGGEQIKNVSYMVVLFSILLTAVLIPLIRLNPLKAIFGRLFSGWVQAETSGPVRTGH